MARSYRPVDRDQQFMMPPDVRDWVPSDHLVWFIIEVVDSLDISAFQARSRLGGAGREPYDPRMLLTVLTYAYACGQRSSRKIERLCGTDTTFMVACGLDAPDHTTIARFRQVHEQALKDLFTQVLVVCARSGLGQVGVVAVDGTKIAANASAGANRGRAWLAEEVEQILTQAGQADAAEDALFGSTRGDELPGDLVNPTTRDQRIRQALAELEAEEAAETAAKQAKADAYRATMANTGGPDSPRPRGRVPAGVDPVTAAQGRLDYEIDVVQRRLAAYDEKAAQAAAQGRRLSGVRPRDVDHSAPVRHAREAVERAKAKVRAAAEKAAEQAAKTERRRRRRPAGEDPVEVAQARLDREIAAVEQRLVDFAETLARATAQGDTLPGRRPCDVDQNAAVRHAREALDRATATGRKDAEKAAANATEKATKNTEGKPSRCRNITDPDSRLMPTRHGWLQGYNAQLAVTADQLIIAVDPIQQPGDVEAFDPMLASIEQTTSQLAAIGADRPVGTVLADAGYRSQHNATTPGPDRLIATGKHRDDETNARRHPTSGPPPPDADPLTAMDHRLRTPEGRALYKLRGTTVEPVNGQLKDVIGLRRFSRRGLPAAKSELAFAATVHNLLKLFRFQPQQHQPTPQTA